MRREKARTSAVKHKPFDGDFRCPACVEPADYRKGGVPDDLDTADVARVITISDHITASKF
jgi:hypothetical protein